MDFVSIGVPEKVKQDFRELKAEVEKRQSTDSPVSGVEARKGPASDAASAFSAAFTTAASDPIRPASPAPFAP